MLLLAAGNACDPQVYVAPDHDRYLLAGDETAFAAVARIQPRLRPGALVIADNADDSPDYLAYVRDPAKGYVSTPFGEDVELSMWGG